MLNPILTIAIPTYNRPEALHNLLMQLLSENLETFKILISDNSQSDDTEKMVVQLQTLFPSIHYKRNINNVGYSSNVMNLYELVDTPFIWFLCDDDVIKPGAVEKILNALNDFDPDVAIFNCIWDDSFGKKQVAGVKNTICYQDIDNFKNYSGLFRATFLSVLVIKKNSTLNLLRNNPESNGNVFIQIAICLLVLSNSRNFKFCEIAEIIVYRNVGFNYGEFFKFNLIDPIKATRLITHKLNTTEFERILKKNLLSTFQLFLSQKVGLFNYDAPPNKETFKDIIKYYKLTGALIIFLWIVCCLTPAFLIRFGFLIKLSLAHGGIQNGFQVYKELYNRAKKDTRASGFTTIC